MGFLPFGLDVPGLVGEVLGNGATSATLVKVTRGTRNPANPTQGTNPQTVNYACVGIVVEYSTRDIDGELVTARDRRITIPSTSLPSGIEPGSGDRVIIDGNTYEIVRVTRDAFGASFEVQGRG